MAQKKKKALEADIIDDLLMEDATKNGDFVLGEAQAPAPVEAPADIDVPALELDDAEPMESVDLGKTEVSKGTGISIVANAPDFSNKTEVSNSTEISESVIAKTSLTHDDATMRINSTRVASSNQPPATASIAMPPPPPSHSESEDRVRASVGRFAPFRSSSGSSSTEAALAQSESLRIAQNRLLEFEQEIERLRTQNEELAAAGETLRRRTDELLASNQKRESDYQHAIAQFDQEKEILSNSKEALQRDLEITKQKGEELELRISSNIQKIRVRERELENRLELVRMESAALIRSKDELILDLKRQIDQLNIELNNYRNKNQELNRQTNDKQEMLRRTVKALRLALSMLEGEEENPAANAQRKAK